MATKKKGGDTVKTIVMPDDLWLELRMQALKEKTSASEILRRLASDYLKKAKKGEKWSQKILISGGQRWTKRKRYKQLLKGLKIGWSACSLTFDPQILNDVVDAVMEEQLESKPNAADAAIKKLTTEVLRVGEAKEKTMKGGN